jgi:hypothetical protein
MDPKENIYNLAQRIFLPSDPSAFPLAFEPKDVKFDPKKGKERKLQVCRELKIRKE